MRRILNTLLTITLVLEGMTGHASLPIKGEIAGTKVICDQARINRPQHKYA